MPYPCPATWSLDLVSGELRSREARARMLGYDAEAVGASQEWWDALIHPDERIAVHSTRSSHIQGSASGYRSEYRAQRRDGCWIWLLEVGCIERTGSEPLRASGILLDITLEREQQFGLQQRLERLRTVFDYTYQFAGLLSRDGVLLESNDAELKAAGITPSGAVGKLLWETPCWERQPAADIALLRDGIERAGRGEFVRFQYHTVQPRGSVRIVDFSLLPVLDDDAQVLWILSEGRDVTDIVNVHKALRALEERLAVATSSSNLGLWDVNVDTGEAWLNDSWWTMLGYEPHELSCGYDVWRELLHPDDLLPALAVLEHRSGEQTDFRIEYRLRSRDGSWRWIHCCGRTVARNDLGEPLRVAGVHLDVTERKEAQIRLAAAARLESSGNPAVGMTCEIDSPTQFVPDSVHVIRDAMLELLQLTDRMRTLAALTPTAPARSRPWAASCPVWRSSC